MLFSHILVTKTLKLKAATIFAVKKEAKQKQSSSKGHQGLCFLPLTCKIWKRQRLQDVAV